MSEAGHPSPPPDRRPPGLPLPPPPAPPRRRYGWVAVPLIAAIAIGAAIGIVAAAGSDDDESTPRPPVTTATPLPRRTSPAATAAPSGHEVSDPEGRYVMTIGDDWSELDTPSAQGIATWSVGTSTTAFAPNVNVLAQDAPGMDLTSYLTNSLDHMGGLDVLDHGVVTGSDGTDRGMIAYAGTPPGSSIELRFLAIVDVRNGTAALATFTAPPAEFDELRASVEPYLLTLQAT